MPDKPILLTTKEMALFVHQGFLRFDEVVPRDLCDRARKDFSDLGPRVWEKGGTAWDEMWRDRAIGEVFRLPRVEGIINSLVGPHPRYDHHAVHFVGAKQKFGANLHQDAEYDVRDLAFDVQFSVFLTDIGPERGGTLFVPGTHLRRVHESQISRYHNVLGQIQTVCKAGTVFVWHHNVWHSSRSNHTTEDRHMFKLRLNANVPQVRLWDCSDLEKAKTKDEVIRILSEVHPLDGQEHRLAHIQKIRLWRHLSGDPTFDFWSYLYRLGAGSLSLGRGQG